MNHTLTKAFTFKNLRIVLVVLFILSLLPIIFIAFYNQPSADDFSYGEITRRQFVESGNVLKVIGSAIDSSKHFYNSWQGTFAAAFLMSLQPAVFNESLYVITTFLLISMLIFPTFFMLYIICKKIIKCSPKYIVVFGVPMCFLSIQCLPSAVQGFFWFNGSVFYTFFYGVMLIVMALCLRVYAMEAIAVPKKRAKQIASLVVCGLLCIVLGGGNYVTALTSTILLFCLFLLSVVKRKPPLIITAFGVLFLITIVSLIISGIAPGNLVRQTNFSQPGTIETVFLSFEYAWQGIFEWCDSTMVAAMVFLIPAFYLVARETNFAFKYPLLVTAFSFCIFAAQYAPPVYAMSNIGQERLQNIIYYSFVWMVVINGFYWTGWFAGLLRKNSIDLKKVPPSHYASGAIAIIAFTLLINVNAYKTMTSFICAMDIVNGSAKQYSQEVNERYTILHDDTVKEVHFKALSQKPAALFFDDITTDKNDWRNKAVASFYEKEYVVILEKTDD